MIKYSDLIPDSRLQAFGGFLARVLKPMNLTDDQCDQLLFERTTPAEDPLFQAVFTFIASSRKLIVCGDYDCDGVTSTAIALLLAKQASVKTGYYIPNRIDEGYGTSVKTVETAFEKGYDSIILIDNGVKAFDALKRARELGLRTCVVDHHTFDEPVLSDVFLHPDLLSAPFHAMCAAGLMACVAESSGLLSPYIQALACVGTIGDVMPLWNKNREIVKTGLIVMNRERPQALQALLPKNVKVFDAQTVAFQIVPKLNAVGRLADVANVNTLIQYLISEDSLLIQGYVGQIENINHLRKEKSKQLKIEALKQITDTPVQIIYDHSFHEGLLGIVANQIMGVTGKPTFLFQETEHGYKGSARSNSLSLHTLLHALNPDYFTALGGHDFAFGMTVRKEAFQAFQEDIQKAALSLPDIREQETEILLDVPIDPDGLSKLVNLEPFGSGFQLPRFAIPMPENTRIQKLGTFGYKFVFDYYWLSHAVYFNTEFDPSQIDAQTLMCGRLSMSPLYGLSFTVETIL